MSLEDIKHSPFQRQRNILYLISQYLSDFGLKQTKSTLWNEANLSPDYKICDNIDLDTIFLDFCSYHHLKFGKLPKILKKIEIESNELLTQRAKVNKSKNSENSTKISDECQKNMKKDVSEQNKNNCLIVTGAVTNAVSNAGDGQKNVLPNGISNLGPKFSEHLDLFEPFFGEVRELAYVIERQIVRKDNQIKWKDVQGNEHAKQILNESVILPLKYPQLFTDFMKPWKGILLHGVSGVGKTLLAKALNSETFDTVTFFNISASTLISKWRGESEKIAKVLFTMAKSTAPAIIFIDEFESLASRRDVPHDHEATKRFKNELLVQIDDLDMDSGHVLLLANSNCHGEEIDEAFLRRFERKILIDLPNEANRISILNHSLPCTRSWPLHQVEEIIESSDGFTGADLKIACKEASMIQIRNKLQSHHSSVEVIEVTFDALLTAIKQIKPSMAASAMKHRQWHSKFGSQSN